MTESTYDAAVIAAIGQRVREQALTADDLDAMPDGVYVLDSEGDRWVKHQGTWKLDYPDRLADPTPGALAWGVLEFAPLTPTTSTTGRP